MSTTFDLLELLDQQADALQAVLTVLGTERDALRNRDAEALNRAGARKESLLTKLDALEHRRLALTPDDEAMQRLADDAQVAGRWNDVVTLTIRCREINDANGAMIRRQHQRIEHALGILRGIPESPAVYGPDGGNERTGRRKDLASA